MSDSFKPGPTTRKVAALLAPFCALYAWAGWYAEPAVWYGPLVIWSGIYATCVILSWIADIEFPVDDK